MSQNSIWGWYPAGNVWVKLQVAATGKLVIDPTAIFEEPPTNGEMEKAATSNWSFDHNANVNAHHTRLHTMTDVLDHSGRIALSQMTLGGAGLVLTGQGAGDPVYAAAGATKEIFVPCHGGTSGLMYETGYFVNGAGDQAWVQILIPADYVSTTSIELIFSPNTTAAAMYCNIITSWGNYNGEAKNIHTETANNRSLGAVVLNQNKAHDISDLVNVAALAVGDLLSVSLTYNATATATELMLRGIRLKYA